MEKKIIQVKSPLQCTSSPHPIAITMFNFQSTKHNFLFLTLFFLVSCYISIRTLEKDVFQWMIRLKYLIDAAAILHFRMTKFSPTKKAEVSHFF